MLNRYFLPLLCLLLGSCVCAESPQQAEDARLAKQCRTLLEKTLVDWYLPNCVDVQHGGYFERTNESGKFIDGEKFLTLQARHVWFFSRLAVADIRKDESLAAAEAGYQFLRNHFYDSKHGGYFTKTQSDGAPTDRRKHVYPMSFVIYAFVQYAEATGKTEPLDAAMELFRTLDQHCYDHENGGYQEFFYEDFRVIADPNESGYIGAIGTKTYNSHLHLMEAFTALFETRPDAIVRQRLSELLQINTVSVKHPSLACNLDGWNLDWSMIRTPKNLRTSYGHDVECVWLALDAARALNRPSRSLAGWAQAICDQSIKHGYDQEHGGFFYTGPLDRSSDDRKKEWWTQSEALVAMLTMQRLFKDDPETKARYRKIFDRTLSFVRTHHLVGSEDRPGGGWWATVHENGDPIDSPSRTSMWQGAYHNGRALLECESLLLDGGKKADR